MPVSICLNIFTNKGTPNLDDLKPTILWALVILISIMVLMIIASVICCICRRKSGSNGFRSNRCFRLFGYQRDESPLYQMQRQTTLNEQLQQQQNPHACIKSNNVNNRVLSNTVTTKPASMNDIQRASLNPTTSREANGTSASASAKPIHGVGKRVSHNPAPPSYEEGKFFHKLV